MLDAEVTMAVGGSIGWSGTSAMMNEATFDMLEPSWFDTLS
jgi:hypothetical protein